MNIMKFGNALEIVSILITNTGIVNITLNPIFTDFAFTAGILPENMIKFVDVLGYIQHTRVKIYTIVFEQMLE